ncbi:MAG: hypothetical protein QX198_01025 [Methylococcaceae bacterium]
MQHQLLMSFHAMRNISLSFSLLLMVGCAQLGSGLNEGYTSRYQEPYVSSDFDELLAFGANMARISTAARADVCHTLLKPQKTPPGADIHLHLMVARLLSDACGDIPTILEGVASIPPESIADQRMQRLIAIDTETLKRLQNTSKKIVTLERKQKTSQSMLDSKEVAASKNVKGSKKNEANLLREKLEAIRSMEKHLDESGDAN